MKEEGGKESSQSTGTLSRGQSFRAPASRRPFPSHGPGPRLPMNAPLRGVAAVRWQPLPPSVFLCSGAKATEVCPFLFVWCPLMPWRFPRVPRAHLGDDAFGFLRVEGQVPLSFVGLHRRSQPRKMRRRCLAATATTQSGSCGTPPPPARPPPPRPPDYRSLALPAGFDGPLGFVSASQRSGVDNYRSGGLSDWIPFCSPADVHLPPSPSPWRALVQ